MIVIITIVFIIASAATIIIIIIIIIINVGFCNIGTALIAYIYTALQLLFSSLPIFRYTHFSSIVFNWKLLFFMHTAIISVYNTISSVFSCLSALFRLTVDSVFCSLFFFPQFIFFFF